MSLIDLSKLSPATFPTAEDDEYEFKSSLLKPDEAKKELNCAASAFANTGGGCFIWGVDKNGIPDGGVDRKIGRQDLRDWIDQAIHRVEAAPGYNVSLYDDAEGRGTLDAGKVIAAVSIHPGVAGNHMAADKRYYVRAGAHTVKAGHFLVESLRARRQVGRPILSYILRLKPHYSSVVQLGVIALTDTPAIDVRMTFAPLKKHMVEMFDDLPIRVAVIERSTPYFVDITTTIDVVEELGDDVTLTIEYKDLMQNEYTFKNEMPLYKALQPHQIGIDDPLKQIAGAITDLGRKFDKWVFDNKQRTREAGK